MYIVKAKSVPIALVGNGGQRGEMVVRYTLTGDIAKASGGRKDRFDVTSDIPSMRCSVKTAGFSLMHGDLCVSQDDVGIIDEYFERTHSTLWAYLAKDGNIYMMNADEFRKFVTMFHCLSHESNKGKRLKVQHSGIAMSEKWLAAQVKA